MIAIVTVTGLDHTGIVAAVSTRLCELGINILNITQTIMGEYFTMIMQCELDDARQDIGAVQDELTKIGEASQVVIRVQSEAIFHAMHEV
jgi:ACT domain-containing protein